MENTSFMKVDEVAQELGVSKSYAYKIVQKLNEELKKQGLPHDFGTSQQAIFYGTHLLRCYSEREVKMSVYKDTKNNSWKVYYRFTDWQGKVHQSTKRGFSTKREALAWEREQLH